MRALDVLRLVSAALQDLDPGAESRWRWEGDERDSVGLLDFLNQALAEVVMQRPDATARTGIIRLVSGLRQGLPDQRHGAAEDAALFISLNLNMGEDGRTPGLPIFAATPDKIMSWAACGGLTGRWNGVEFFAHDRMADPLAYWVYPAVPEDRRVCVEATWSVRPPHISSPEDCLPLRDVFAPALAHHVLYGILSGDNEASNLARAQHHLSAFYQAMGVKGQTDASWPKTASGRGGGQ